jgi:hypothetical protein
MAMLPATSPKRRPMWQPVSEPRGSGSISDFLLLPELLASFGRLGHDVVEMVVADQDG